MVGASRLLQVCGDDLAAALDDMDRDGLAAPIIPGGRPSPPGPPQHLVLTLTESCALRCRYCLYTNPGPHGRPHRRRHMSRATAMRALDWYLPQTAFPLVSMYGGEPLLRPGIARAVAARVRAAGGQVVIDTGGTLLARHADWIAGEGIRLQVSLDGPEDIHDLWRGAGSHAAVMRGLDALLQADPAAGGRITWQCTLAPPWRLHERDDWFRGLPGTVLASWATWGHMERPPDLSGRERELAPLRAAWIAGCAAGRRGDLGPLSRALFDRPAILWWRRRRGFGRGPLTAGCCRPGERKAHVTTDGRLQPCERVGHEMTIGDIWSGIDRAAVARLEAAWQAAVGARCRECWAVRLCGLCFATLAPSGGVPEAFCVASRASAEGAIRLYLDLRAAGGEAIDWLNQTVAD